MRKPIVTIVGRPNVGKSTLFNRIIRRREAIVDDQPGVTRDRKGVETDWEGIEFFLFDTGGFIPKTTDIIEAGVSRQVRTAIEESDIVVFLVDCTTGITNFDDDVAKILRKRRKPNILAVNKVDSFEKDVYAAEFYNLGLGEPISISGMGGRNIGDLLSLITSHIKKIFNYSNTKSANEQQNISSNSEDNIIKLAIVGRPNTGKSTYINKLLNKDRVLVTEIPGTTRDSVDVGIKFEGKKFLLIDTAGLRKRPKVTDSIEFYSNIRTQRVIERCDAACIFTDASAGFGNQDMHILRSIVDAQKGVILVINKWDLLNKDEQQLQSLELNVDYRLKGLSYIPVITISSLKGIRVHKLLNKVEVIARERKKRIPSPELNKLLDKLNRTYQPPAVGGKLVRIKYGVQASVNPPKIVLFSNYPQLVMDSYKNYLEKRIRKKFGFKGVPISIIFKKK